MLTDEQCNEFRRLPMSFNDMVRAIYEAGRASKAAEYAYIRREARNAALEEAAKVCNLPNNFIPADCADSIRALKDQP
jgi:hypothetical protein